MMVSSIEHGGLWVERGCHVCDRHQLACFATGRVRLLEMGTEQMPMRRQPSHQQITDYLRRRYLDMSV